MSKKHLETYEPRNHEKETILPNKLHAQRSCFHHLLLPSFATSKNKSRICNHIRIVRLPTGGSKISLHAKQNR